jgi:protein associated with RNAse G/E
MYGKRKYGNKKFEVNGIKFDSKLEHYCYSSLVMVKADFEFQEKVILVEKFRFGGSAVRAITLTVDFVVNKNGKKIYVDTKGFATEVAKIKYKLLKNKFKDEEVDVIWLKNKKEVDSFINTLIEEK